ncbi:hypothetical protein VNO77_34834 [Canavalia gladiata]|uniref:Cytochrome c domain-containing protein n=1 Tax=Canavalia gladiata TaxID=3824 RepID=A0AAN9KH17_CANGL
MFIRRDEDGTPKLLRLIFKRGLSSTKCPAFTSSFFLSLFVLLLLSPHSSSFDPQFSIDLPFLLTEMAGGVIQQLLRRKLHSHSPLCKTLYFADVVALHDRLRISDSIALPLSIFFFSPLPEILECYNSSFVSSIITKKDAADSSGSNFLGALALFGAGISGFLGFATTASADEAEHGLACPSYPWPHKGILSSYDHSSVRRGHQVYQQVCASCHSMSLISYRDLVGVAYTEQEVKAMAAEIEVVDGPNDEGEMFTRAGKLSDRFPQPYANEAAARFANGGAYPPDLSLITKARHDGQNYAFALLTGYRDPPAGVTIREGLHYNPYFPGGAIAMPKMLNDGAVEYEDGTPATESQMGKDVVTFLSWTAEPEMEERKLMGFKWILILSLALLQAAYYRRLRWSPLKSRKLVLDVIN